MAIDGIQKDTQEPVASGKPQRVVEAGTVRLLQFLDWVVPLVFVFALLTTIASLFFEDGGTVVATGILFCYGLTLVAARALVERGSSEPAVLIICFGLLVAALAMSLVYPQWIPILVITPLLSVAVALPYVEGRTLLRLIFSTWVIAVVMVAVSRISVRPQALPTWFMDVFTISAVAAAVAVVLLLLWQFSSRLRDTLEQTRTAEERYALVERGVNDGLWDWDLTLNVIYYSPRWKAMIQAPETSVGKSPDEWFSRVHPSDSENLRQEIDAHLEGRKSHLEVEYRIRSEEPGLGCLWMLCRGLAVRDETGEPIRLAGSQTDITRRKEAEERLIHEALHDSLTGLPNREMFLSYLGRVIAGRRGAAGKPLFSVLFIDLDNFKTINDSLGHDMGDGLLVAVSERLRSSLRPRDIVARLSGDEFTVLMEGTVSEQEANRVASRLLDDLKAPFMVKGYELYTTASIGLVVDNGEYGSAEEPLRDADTAMYRAKALGRSGIGIFESTMHSRAVALFRLETELRRAMERKEFVVHYQPIISLKTGRIVGVEALVRWEHPERGLLPPAEFIPVAEETGLVLTIELFVLREACHQTALWQKRFPEHQPLNLNVNLSRNQLARPELIDQTGEILRESSLSPSSLRLEITESVLMQNPDLAALTLSRLREMNIQVHIDDFGTGYSSLSALHSFPIDSLKVDRSFIARLAPGDEAEIVQTIVTLAHNLGLDVVAEGIETESHLERLRDMGCDFGQGFLFSKPLDKTSLQKLLELDPRW
ncbi:putative bifunctional diguanylate cyclase/phosphodiesterase [Rubrobacter indicoceani]|uniref:putative bifunctional diguanylate cyclase/phosphodiesterase n=1 Tax=Rubrobacter indicoceani TaxID=2051957 RepID=UPI000E5A1969|nr:GGDEF domain-containing phosphodiesterase [Rubrobacter indicoceani]